MSDEELTKFKAFEYRGFEKNKNECQNSGPEF